MENNTKNKAQIITLALLKAEGKRIAFIKGNRQVQEKNVNSKRASLMENGQIIPAVIVDGEEVQSVDLEIVDAETGEPVAPEDYGKYVVILDGQHRYTAYIQNGDKNKGEFYFMYSLSDGVPLQVILAEANIATKPWTGGDFAGGALLMNKDEPLPVVEFIHELTTYGLLVSSAQRWACRKDMKINAEMLANVMKKKIHPSLKLADNVEAGRKLWEAARKSFSVDVLKRRYFIDFFINKYDAAIDRTGLWDRFIEFLSTMSRTDVDTIEKAKGKKISPTKEQVVLEKLEELYTKFEAEAK